MAHVISFNTAATRRPASQGLFTQVRKAFADYVLYRQTLGELQTLTDRELRDLGLSRHSIRQVAFDSVYGA